MKTFFVLVLIACAILAPARADVPAPKPTVITVTNLAAFPKYKFTYRTEGQPETRAIPDGRPFSAHRDLELLVQSGSEAPQSWEKIRYDWKGAAVAVKVEAVKQEGQTITVIHQTTGGFPAPGRKSADATPSLLPFYALTGVGACGLVLLVRRRKAD